MNCVSPVPSEDCSAVAVVREDQKRLRSPRSIGFSVAGLLGIDHHPHDGKGYIGRLINSAAWVALSAGHADTAAIGRVGPLARAAPRLARMLLAHPAGIKADQRVESSLSQRAVGYTFERPIRRSSGARFNPARPLLELLMGSLSIRRSAAATRSRARSKSATVYCRGSGRVRFLRGRFAALLPRMSCFAVATCHFDIDGPALAGHGS